MMQKQRILAVVVMTLSLLCGMPATAADLYSTISNVGYIDDAGADAYRSERCKLDLYLPQGKKDFPTVVFFHGGGLEGGEKFIPELLKEHRVLLRTLWCQRQHDALEATDLAFRL